MNDRKENILNIEYQLQKGLIFSWNLMGLLSKDVYFRHLFFFTSNRQKFLETVLSQICAKIKIGDFIAVSYKKNERLKAKLRWFERTASNFDTITLKGIEKTETCEFLSFLPMLASAARQCNSPLLLNVFVQTAEEVPQYKQAIQKLRLEGYFPYHVNFFADFAYHDISPATGFNEINTNEDTLGQVIRVYRSLVFESAAVSMKLEVDCSDIQVGLRKDRVWQPVDFGRIKRCYYGPSIYYEQDCLSLLDESAGGSHTHLPMVVSLEITLFSGKVLKAEKSLILTTENIRLYGLTRCERSEPRSTYEYSKIIRSKTQPFCSHSSLFITKFLTS